jgi:hypothetical protein
VIHGRVYDITRFLNEVGPGRWAALVAAGWGVRRLRGKCVGRKCSLAEDDETYGGGHSSLPGDRRWWREWRGGAHIGLQPAPHSLALCVTSCTS